MHLIKMILPSSSNELKSYHQNHNLIGNYEKSGQRNGNGFDKQNCKLF